MAKKLNVRKTNNSELSEKWGIPVNFSGDSFIRCNSKGEVNWEKSSTYSSTELIERNNVNLIKQ